MYKTYVFSGSPEGLNSIPEAANQDLQDRLKGIFEDIKAGWRYILQISGSPGRYLVVANLNWRSLCAVLTYVNFIANRWVHTDDNYTFLIKR